jgi:ribokinase
MKILTIGGATIDTFMVCKDMSQLNFDSEHENRSFLLFEEGQKIPIDHILFHTGGGATNSAVSFTRLGFETSTFFKVGKDQAAEFILNQLKEIGINTAYVKQSAHEISGNSFIIPCQSGDRVVLAYRGANANLTEEEIPTDALKDCKNLYITSLSGQSSHLLVPITRMAKQHGAFIANNPGTSQLAIGSYDMYEALPNIDIFILNSQEACTFMLSMIQQDIKLHQKILDAQAQKSAEQKNNNLPHLLQNPMSYQSICFDIRLFFKEVLSRGPKIVIVTNGAEGVYAATQNEIIFHPSLPGHIENTLGAGDAFGSCLVAQYIKGKSVKDAILYGILNASSVISHIGAKEGLLKTEELEQKCKNTPKNLFQTFRID